jgi:hypothetical protein
MPPERQPDVPFYLIEMGGHGGLSYSRAELEAMTWLIVATLGG